MPEQLHFKISAALKDIIGKDLITDDYIAVFELVKNAYDAYANEVFIYFENVYSQNGKIIIKDNGKGMNYDDLASKWLFVAYSAKKEGTEDESWDYRSRIRVNRAFAGAKGIGRFSCDRLGKLLYLETKKDEPNSKIEVLITDWEKFEGDLKDEFINISVLHETKLESDYNIKHGTVLEITELRSTWDRSKLLKLKESLSKLINPKRDTSEENFKITIQAPEELDEDELHDDVHEKVNGDVENFIFDALDLKTTKIITSISNDGNFITTELLDGGTLIYKIKEPNQFNLPSNTRFTIYYMNMSAKQTFTRRMGIQSNRFGHIFLYKNGFRIYPYGEPGEDPFKIDKRKAQGRNRYLGTYEILGQIEINSDSDEFKETSSRGDGLIKTAGYEQLEACFIEVLKRLEKYVVDVQQWGLSIEDDSSFEMKARVSDLIAKLTGSTSIIEFETADNFSEILEASQSESAEAIAKNLSKIATESGNEALIELVSKANEKLHAIQLAKEEAEIEAAEEQKRALQATEQLREQVSENLFLKSINTSEFQEVISLLHHIGIYAGTIDNTLKGISLRIQNNIPLSNEELHRIIRLISFETKKILNISAFATKANFKLTTEDIEVNLPMYIREYIQNIIPTIVDKVLKIKLLNFALRPFMKLVKPIEINIVIDNIVNNARKAGADMLQIELRNQDSGLEVKFIDNGVGISDDNMKKIYDFGFTTTDGSGIGLYHVKEVMQSMGGSIKAVNNENGKGVTFILEFN